MVRDTSVIVLTDGISDNTRKIPIMVLVSRAGTGGMAPLRSTPPVLTYGLISKQCIPPISVTWKNIILDNVRLPVSTSPFAIPSSHSSFFPPHSDLCHSKVSLSSAGAGKTTNRQPTTSYWDSNARSISLLCNKPYSSNQNITDGPQPSQCKPEQQRPPPGLPV